MTTTPKCTHLVSLGSPEAAADQIKQLLGLGCNTLKTDSDLCCTNLDPLASSLVNPSVADVENIFSISLDFTNQDQKDKEQYIKNKFKEFSQNNRKLLDSYLWIEISDMGKVVVVGRTTIRYNDLLKKYTFPLGDTAKALAEYYHLQRDTTEHYVEQINQKITGAVIIPVKINSEFPRDETHYISKVETQIGEQIVRAYGAINASSHTSY